MGLVRTKPALLALAALTLAYAAMAALMQQGYALSSFANLTQGALLVFALVVFLHNARRANSNRRAFWVLMSIGQMFWVAGQLGWIYYEQIRRQEMPSPSFSDAFFFLHVVPWIAAATMQPHADIPQRDHRLRIVNLDFALLLVWWVFLYSYVVMPWQYVSVNATIFINHFNVLYMIENLTFILGMAVLWQRAQGGWKRIYKNLFIAAAAYSISSYALNSAIVAEKYYSGSLWDLPLVVAMAWFSYAGLAGDEVSAEPAPAMLGLQWQAYGQSLLAAVALLSMPVMALLANTGRLAGGEIASFRLLLTLGFMPLMMIVLFLRQNLLDHTLMRLLQESRDSYQNLEKLQGHLLQSEKLASIGRLVAGAAHEINNPLTAIVGYSDLMASQEGLPPQQREFAEKILVQARRTKNLVSSLLTFAKQTPAQSTLLDLNMIAENALQLQVFGQVASKVEILCDLDRDLPRVMGDPNRLLQVFMHIQSNAMDAMLELGPSGVLSIRTEAVNGQVVWSCSDTGPGITSPDQIFDPFYTTKAPGKGTGLGLSASYGIVRDHGGSIECLNRPEGGATFLISLPAAAPQEALAQKQAAQ